MSRGELKPTVAAVRPRPFRTLRILAGVPAVAAVLFLLTEGLSSSFLLLGRIWSESRRPPVERVHTRYDPLLGWVGIPNLRLDDFYGPGMRFRTDSRGFRGNHEVAVRVPPGKVRLVCSGDSFTLGYGVGDEQTWCNVLSGLEPRLETVNMGQGGYGLDQTYLWYSRDGMKLDHDLHLVAFITEDLRRMQRSDFLGFGKPVLRLENGRLVTENVPVPRKGYYFPWLSRNAGLFANLRSVELANRALTWTSFSAEETEAISDSETWKVSLQVFQQLDGMNRRKRSILVLVSLPDAADFSVRKSDGWRASLSREAAERGILFVDLVEEIRRLPPDAVPALYNPDFHFSERGNEWVATVLLQRLREIPVVARRLAGPPPLRREPPEGQQARDAAGSAPGPARKKFL